MAQKPIPSLLYDSQGTAATMPPAIYGAMYALQNNLATPEILTAAINEADRLGMANLRAQLIARLNQLYRDEHGPLAPWPDGR